MRTATHRRGSILLLVIAIVVTLVILAATFVRVAELRHGSNLSEHKRQLAREAGRIGLNHALEQILRDFQDEPFTRMDAGSRAVFTAHDRPYDSEAYHTDQNLPGGFVQINRDDVPVEHSMWPLTGTKSSGSYMNGGASTFSGRGRFIEPEFYFLPDSGYDPARTRAVTPIRFSQPYTSGARPDRSEGLFYDERLRPITGDPIAARAAARYRLRYAVGTIDLDGALLVNGDPGVNYRDIRVAEPGRAPNLAAGRVIQAQHALGAIIEAGSLWGDPSNAGESDLAAGTSAGVRAEHVFIGRGYASNYDRQASTNNAPVTFPLMYREAGDPTRFNDSKDRIATGIYQNGSVAGDEEIGINRGTYRRIHMGPQFSFFHWERAVSGGAIWDDGAKNGWVGMGTRYTPFGRGVTRGPTDRWSGPVWTPWCINLMTATPNLVHSMLIAYMPPGAMGAHYSFKGDDPSTPTVENNKVYYATTRPVTGARDLTVDSLWTAFGRYPAPQRGGVTPDYHLLPNMAPTDPGFRDANERYPGPIAANGFDAAGNWLSDSLGTFLRSTGGTHPGYDVLDIYSGQALFGGTKRGGARPLSYQAPTPPPGEKVDHAVFGTREDSIWDVVGDAMAAALAVARGQYLQYPAQSDKNSVTEAATYFDGGPWSGPRVTSLADVDALFLANLGTSMANPTDPTPTLCWTGDQPSSSTAALGLRSFTPDWNLAGLRTATDPTGTYELLGNQVGHPDHDPNRPDYDAVEATAAIELIINDMRLSFFGCSPAYTASFRALDLNGDGRAHCSAFGSNLGATAREVDLDLDQYTTSLTATGFAVDPVVNHFSLTGTFFIGHSRTWRVMVRGELWDEVRKSVAASAQVDTVFTIDPTNASGEWQPGGAGDPALGHHATHVIFQRWYYDTYRGLASRQY